jgi:hypothetical protein
MPDPLVIPVYNLENLPAGWKIINVVGYKAKDGEAGAPPTFIRADAKPILDESELPKLSVVWKDLSPGVDYRLEFILHGGESAAKPDEIKGLIEGGKILTPKAYY